jgi:hypothetical protein
LEKHHAGVPHRGGSTQKWQEDLANHRLHQKQNGGAGENSQHEKNQGLEMIDRIAFGTV